MSASVSVSVDGNVAVAHVDGEVDLSNVRSVHRQLADAAGGEVLGLVVDLTMVRYLDSAAISMLFDLARTLADRRRLLAFASGSTRLRRLLRITDLTSLVPLRDTVEECVSHIRGDGTPAA